MRTRALMTIGLLLLGGAAVGWGQDVTPTSITYQGQLLSNGQPAPDGTYDMTFTLWDAEEGGNLLGTVTDPNVQVTGSVFTVWLDFGFAPFTGAQCWIEVTVGLTPLTPRQPITPAPLSLKAHGLVVPVSVSGDENPLVTVTGTAEGGHVMEVHADPGAGVSATAFRAYYIPGGNHVKLAMPAAAAYARAATGIAVMAEQTAHGTAGYLGTTAYGVHGVAPDPNYWAGYFEGRGYFSDAVGIGTDTPEDASLHVVSNGQRAIRAQITDGMYCVSGEASGTTAIAISGYHHGGGVGVKGQSGSGVGVYGISQGDEGVLGFNLSANTLAYLAGTDYAVYGEHPGGGFAGYFDGNVYASGNVGIGTSNPARHLEISADRPIARLSSETHQYGPVIELQNMGIGHTNLGGLNFLDHVGSARAQVIGQTESLVFQTIASGSAQTRLMLDADGHVGIGMLAPTEALTVAGTIESTTGGFKLPDGTIVDDASDLGGGGTSLWSLNGSDIYYDAGRVGIGADDPNSLLHLASLGSAELTLEADTNNGGGEDQNAGIAFSQDGGLVTGRLGYNHDGEDNALALMNYANYPLLLGANSTEYLRVTSDGKVGIGTSSPTDEFDVAGKVKCEELQVTAGATAGYVLTADGDGNAVWAPGGAGGTSLWSQSGSDIYYDAGNVGMGTSSPQETLDVVGNMRASSSQPSLILHDTNAGGSKPVIRFENSDRLVLQGEDDGEEKLGIYSTFHYDRINDASLQVYGRSSGTWGNYIELTHDGTDGYVSTDTGHLVLDPMGNVGVGTTDPQATLDVAGSVRCSSDSHGGSTLSATVNPATPLIDSTYAVYGETTGSGGYTSCGVYGTATATSGSAFGIGGTNHTPNGAAVLAVDYSTGNWARLGTASYGARAQHEVTDNYTELGRSDCGARAKHVATGNYADLGRSDCGAYIYGPDNNGTNAALKIITSSPSQTMLIDGNEIDVVGGGGLALNVNAGGDVLVPVLEITGGSDLAEPFDVSPCDNGAVAPGMVVVINPAAPGQLTVADMAYDPKVAGIVSGANGLKPGMVMKSEGQPHVDGEHPVALTGRVWCWCDATYGAIRPGDRLTTSATPGHAMKVSDTTRAPGAVVGKAMTELPEGCGLVLVLVQPQ